MLTLVHASHALVKRLVLRSTSSSRPSRRRFALQPRGCGEEDEGSAHGTNILLEKRDGSKAILKISASQDLHVDA